MIFLFLFLSSVLFGDNALEDLEEKAQDFVLETKKIEIPGYPYAFNPSIIRWRDFYLMSFRVISDRRYKYNSDIGLVLLDENFSPISEPQMLHFRPINHPVPSRAEDARLIYVGDKLYIVYSDNEEPQISKGGFRIYIGEIIFDGMYFNPENIQCIKRFEGESRKIREKNWIPFDYSGNLLLAYSLDPHLIFYPFLGNGDVCGTFAKTPTNVQWPLGILRGGTPALPGLVENEYLSFFHSSIEMASLHSDGEKVLHYFMGAYTFSSEYPFPIHKVSPEPIIGKKFYKGQMYKPYWHPVRVVFPGGFVFNEKFIWLVYGRQDHEVWVAKIDRKKLLESLVPLDP